MLALTDAVGVNEEDAKEQWRLVTMTLDFMDTHPIVDETPYQDCITAFELTMEHQTQTTSSQAQGQFVAAIPAFPEKCRNPECPFTAADKRMTGTDGCVN